MAHGYTQFPFQPIDASRWTAPKLLISEEIRPKKYVGDGRVIRDGRENLVASGRFMGGLRENTVNKCVGYRYSLVGTPRQELQTRDGADLLSGLRSFAGTPRPRPRCIKTELPDLSTHLLPRDSQQPSRRRPVV